MKRLSICTIACLLFFVPALPLSGTDKSDTASSPPSPARLQFVSDLYPNLTTGALAWAQTSELPKGVLLRAGELVIHDNELSGKIATAPEQVQPKLAKNAFFVLEQMATFKLLLAEATAEAAKNHTDISQKDQKAIIQDYLQTLVKTVKAADSEILDFYTDNKEMFAGASLAQVKPQIDQFLQQQKQQEVVDEHIRTIGKRIQIDISTSWLKTQAALAQDNVVDKARTGGRASLVDFGSTGCVPCDMMAPILDTLREKYKGRINVVFIHVGEEPILASRYGVQSIPVQIFFDKTGKEVFRHVGFFPQEQIEKKLSQIGINNGWKNSLPH